MQVKFDKLNQYEVPLFYLCNPGSVHNVVSGINSSTVRSTVSNMIGAINNISDEEIVMNFNAISELQFRVHKVDPQNDGFYEDSQESYNYKIFNSLKNRRYIFVEDIGYFVITGIKDGYDNGVEYKDITASSCEVELQNRALPFIVNNTFTFADLLSRIINTMPMWEIEEGDISDELKNRSRTFEDIDVSKNILAFLMEDMQDAYECIFEFDILNRKIKAYDQNSFIKHTNIHLTKDDIIRSMDVSENSDELYTAMSVFGSDQLSINDINPLGTSVIYNFDYYLDWMSDKLKNKVIEWQKEVNACLSKNSEFYNNTIQYYKYLDLEYLCKAEVDRIDLLIKLYQQCIENIVATNDVACVDAYNTAILGEDENAEIIEYTGDPVPEEDMKTTIIGVIQDILYNNEHTYTVLDNVSGKPIRCTANGVVGLLEGQMKRELSIHKQVEKYKKEIFTVRNDLSFSTYFCEKDDNDVVSTELLDELYNYIFEGMYTDEYVIITDEMTLTEQISQKYLLYQRAKTRLNAASCPTQEFSISVENFVFDKTFKDYSEELNVGCLINVELKSNDIAELFLSSIQLNWSDKDLTLTFGNRLNKYDPKSLFQDILGDIQKSANTLEYLKSLVAPLRKDELGELAQQIRNSRNLTMSAALASSNEEVIIDGSGYTGRRVADGEIDDNQIKITSNSIVLTNDGWNTSHTAIGRIILSNNDGKNDVVYGVNAETLIGNAVLGTKLNIVDEAGFSLLSVVDGKIETYVQEKGITDDIDDLKYSISQVKQTNDSVSVRIETIENNGVDKITTSNDYTFNESGLHISDSESNISNSLTNAGMYVVRDEGTSVATNMLIANKDGVVATDVKVNNFLIVGDHIRFESYDDNSRMACYWIGS